MTELERQVATALAISDSEGAIELVLEAWGKTTELTRDDAVDFVEAVARKIESKHRQRKPFSDFCDTCPDNFICGITGSCAK